MSGLMNLMEVNLADVLLAYLKAVAIITRPVSVQNSLPDNMLPSSNIPTLVSFHPTW